MRCLQPNCECMREEQECKYLNAIKDALTYANGRWSEWGSRAEETGDILEKALYGEEET